MPFGRPALPLAAMRAKRLREGSDELRRWNASASTVGSQSAAMFNLWGVDGMPIYACGQPTLDGRWRWCTRCGARWRTLQRHAAFVNAPPWVICIRALSSAACGPAAVAWRGVGDFGLGQEWT